MAIYGINRPAKNDALISTLTHDNWSHALRQFLKNHC